MRKKTTNMNYKITMKGSKYAELYNKINNYKDNSMFSDNSIIIFIIIHIKKEKEQYGK